LDAVIGRVGDLSLRSGELHRHAYGEVAFFHRGERAQEQTFEVSGSEFGGFVDANSGSHGAASPFVAVVVVVVKNATAVTPCDASNPPPAEAGVAFDCVCLTSTAEAAGATKSMLLEQARPPRSIRRRARQRVIAERC